MKRGPKKPKASPVKSGTASRKRKLTKQIDAVLQEGVKDGTIERRKNRYYLTLKGSQESEANAKQKRIDRKNARAFQEDITTIGKYLCRMVGLQSAEWDVNEGLAKALLEAHNSKHHGGWQGMVSTVGLFIAIAKEKQFDRYMDPEVVAFARKLAT